MASLEGEVRRVTDKVLEIQFKGEKAIPKYNDIKDKLSNLKKGKLAPV